MLYNDNNMKKKATLTHMNADVVATVVRQTIMLKRKKNIHATHGTLN